MELKTVTVKNGIYQCDIGISVEEWQDILLDENLMNDNYKNALMKFYAEPKHRSTCKHLGEKYGVSPQSFNSTITNFAKAVQKKLNRFDVVGTDGKPSYWIIPMIGRYVGEYFEWALRDELVKALEEINKEKKHLLQVIYDDAINNKDRVFFEWEPTYIKFVNEYKEQATSGNWTDDVFFRLIKKTNKNGISDLSQQNFTWEEYEKIKNDWSEIQPKIKDITVKGSIDNQTFKDICTFFRKRTKINRRSAYNRIIAALLPNFVTTIVTYSYLKKILKELRTRLNDYPDISNNWLQDNINFINYCNANVTFKHEWHSSLFAWYLQEHFERETTLIKKSKKEMNQYIQLLKTNKNLILTGAPGTGKTYLAKQMALSMLFQKQDEATLTEEEQKLFAKHFCFVQFHPSYDYTDFVEGLRAEDLDGQVMFSLHNGIFKSFCKNAILPETDGNFDELYDQFLDDVSENDITFKTPTYKKKFRVEVNSRKTCVAIPSTAAGTRMSVTKDLIRDYVINDKITDWKPYTTSIGNYFKENYPIDTTQKDKTDLPYIFIIDEINRGEISKIFGELFFSIDPGYRGRRGKVKTQYANMQSGETVFDDELGQGWFYVPENVYIIGTMNDIDRSVESMDFAMRRRFAWKAIKADDRIGMWDGQIDDLKEAEKRMKSLNQEIEKVQGLSAAYHVGPAYFLKLNKDNYTGDFDALWNNHLEGLLFEYLRGMPNEEELLNKLKSAYDLTTQTNEIND